MACPRPALALLIALTACGGAAPAPTAAASAEQRGRELLERHLRWRGAAPAEVDLEGDATLSQQQARIRLTVAKGGAFRQVVDLGGAAVIKVNGPDGAFIVNLSGAVEPLAEHERLSMQREMALRFGRGLGDGATVTGAGTGERDGRSWDILRISYGAHDGVDLYLDHDGGLTWVRVTDDASTSWAKLAGWAAGVPRTEESYDDAGKLLTRVVWSRVEAVAAPDAQLFRKPTAKGLTVVFAGGASETPWIPIELRNEKIVVRGQAGGREADLLLDSGAGITLLDIRRSRALGLPRLGGITLAGTGATQEADLVGPLAIQLGPLSVGGLTAVATDLGIVGDGGAEGLPVIVGKELFGSVVVEADFPGRRIRFHDPGRYQRAGDALPVALVNMADGLIAVELSVHGRPPALFGLDTGGAGALDIFSWYAEENGLLKGRRTSLRKGAGIGGSYLQKVAIVPRVTLAGTTFHDVPVTIPDVKEGAFATRRLAGNLGVGLLSRFRLVFHYAGGVILFAAGDAARPFDRDRSGLQFDSRPEALEVIFVPPGGPGAAAGWKEHDLVVAIDGKKVADLDRQARRAWTWGPAGKKVTLVDGAGKQRELVLADYF